MQFKWSCPRYSLYEGLCRIQKPCKEFHTVFKVVFQGAGEEMKPVRNVINTKEI